MIKEVINKWEENKHKLEEYFKTTRQERIGDYKDIVVKIFELVLTEIATDYGGDESFDISKMTVIDDGDYQGTTIYIIPKDTYQPGIYDYLITNNYYGSCSGCDTLESIREYEDGLPSNKQVKGYMTIALHLVQKMKWLGDDE